MSEKYKLRKIKENVWEIKQEGKMNVPGIVFASDDLMDKIRKDMTLEQVSNVAQLPGIVEKSIAMSDAHQGYGFSIGGVAAFDLKKGIISPGGVGFDINCGVRLLVADINKTEFLKKREEILRELSNNIPSGSGRGGEFDLNEKDMKEVLEKGVEWSYKKGFATKEDIDRIEDNGCIDGADSKNVSKKAKERGRKQLGTLGSGNHFLEIQEVEEIYDMKIAARFGIKEKGQIGVMIHCGSRGLGHQVASDYIQLMEKEYGFKHLPDRQLSYAPIDSKLGKDYLSAMAAAANFAFCNRQIIAHKIEKSFIKFFNCKLNLVYDIAHNIAKFEEHKVNGKKEILCVHRKGATRSFGPGRKEIPKIYRDIGCPIFIPGSMGTYSYVLVGTKKAEEISFGSTAHGAGRVLSRTYAINNLSVEKIKKQLGDYGVSVVGGGSKGLLEEAPEAYKDVNEVVRVSHELGIGNMVARLRPLGVVKG